MQVSIKTSPMNWMTPLLLTNPPLILDADLLSSFAWVDRLDILEKLFPQQMIVLDEVMDELRRVVHLSTRVQNCIDKGLIKNVSMTADSPEALELGQILNTGRYGNGEAACMAYLKNNDGTMYSNNLSDVHTFCGANGKDLITTAMIMHHAVEKAVIDDAEAEIIWAKMIAKRRKLPASSYSAYLASLGQNQ